MNYTIYKTTNTVNNKIYIGKHQTENINDSYLGSGISLERAINKYGKEYLSVNYNFSIDSYSEGLDVKKLVKVAVIRNGNCVGNH